MTRYKMGKKKAGSNLGRSVIKDRFGKKPVRSDDSFLHTSELNDGYDWGRLNLQSVTEQSNLDDFLSTAELAGTEFTAEKLNIKFVNPNTHVELSEDEKLRISQLHKEHKNLLRIPRRPHWDESTSAEELDRLEKDSFLEWRRGLATLQEVEGIVMTPYEKNLDFWRQLWRVIERSDVVVQVVDARNPLLYQCSDLEKYVYEIDSNKVNVLLINKADYLSDKQRQYWKEYFDGIGMHAVFWSALEETERANATQDEEEDNGSSRTESDGSEDEDLNQIDNDLKEIIEEKSHDSEIKSDSNQPSVSSNIHENKGALNASEDCVISDMNIRNSVKVLTAKELLHYFQSVHHGKKVTDGQVTVGMIGYPNVGKSSTINAILKTKKVPVSATPGRTKHFQTLYVDSDLMLCDCPGLVFPSFVSTKAELIINGILPIDQMRDYRPPVSLVCNYIQRTVFETLYGINLPLPPEGDDPNRPPTADELLNTYGSMRGYMSVNGIPDCPRTARYILKDFVNGRLLYCNPPPNLNPQDFQEATKVPEDLKHKQSTMTQKKIKPNLQINSKLDREFFKGRDSNMHCKGVQGAQQTGGASYGIRSASSSLQSLVDKPWKKHHNKGKKEKLRRLYKDDE